MNGRPDALIIGAGPAGSVVATLLARAGARVRWIDRASFPRDKLCGDTLNPGTLARLRRLELETAAAGGLRLDGMLVTGADGLRVEGRYPAPLHARSLLRRDFDHALVELACAAGAPFEPGVAVRRPVIEAGTRTCVAGASIASRGGPSEEVRTPITIAADGRRSTLAFSLGLTRHPARPRRWAVGAYFEHVKDLSALGEMHIRPGFYIGVAPLPGGLANACLVTEPGTGTRFDRLFGDPTALIETAVREDRAIADRFAGARLIGAPTVLGPLAVDRVSRGIDGLLLAGDAAGFIDPMTGDGLRFAVRDAELVAQTALEILAEGWAGAHRRLAARRARAFGIKRQLNRGLRAVVGSPGAVGVTGALVARFPSVIRKLVWISGDLGDAGSLRLA